MQARNGQLEQQAAALDARGRAVKASLVGHMEAVAKAASAAEEAAATGAECDAAAR